MAGGGAIDYCRGSSVSFAKQEPSTRENLDIPTFRHASEFEQGVSVAEHRVLKVRDKKMDLILHILSLQRAGGGIEMDEKLLKYLNLRLDNLQNIAMLIQSSLPVDKVLLLSTAILLSILEVHYGDVPEVWTTMVRKSKDWLDDVIKRATPVSVEETSEMGQRVCGACHFYLSTDESPLRKDKVPKMLIESLFIHDQATTVAYRKSCSNL